MSECLFCKIIAGEIPSEKVYEDEHVLGFKDIAPQAPVHCLFISKKHSQNIQEFMSEHPEQVQKVFKAITTWAANHPELEQSYRVSTNQGASAGQTVFHTHFHVIGGKSLGAMA